MSNSNFIEFKKKRILFMNFADLDLEGVVTEIDAVSEIVAKEPPKSLLVLADLTKSQISKEVAAKWKAFAKHNEPYVKVTALVGVEGIKKVIYQAVLKFSGRKNLILFKSIEEAEEWLVTQ